MRKEKKFYTQRELKEWPFSEDPYKCGIILKNLALQPSGQPRIIKRIEELMQDDRFIRIQVPDIYISIRLLAGFALVAEQAVKMEAPSVIVKNTPLTFKTGDKKMWDQVLPYYYYQSIPKRTLEDYKKDHQNLLDAMTTAYRAGQLPTQDFTIPHDLSIEDFIRLAIHRPPLYP